MRLQLLQLVPALMRHLTAYAEVAGADARDAGVLIARRLLALLLAFGAAVIALVMLCVWVLALTWDGPWRAWTAAGLAILFAAGAAAVGIPLLRRGVGLSPDFFARVRDEWRRDRVLIDRAFNAGPAEDDEAVEAARGSGPTGNGSAHGEDAHASG